MAKNLGSFYVCAAKSDEWRKTHHKRVVILIEQSEIYAQMCKDEQITSNMPIFFKIYKELYNIFNKLDKELVNTNNIRIEVYDVEEK